MVPLDLPCVTQHTARMDTIVLAVLLAVIGLACIVLGSGVVDTIGIVLLVIAAVVAVVGLTGRRSRL